MTFQVLSEGFVHCCAPEVPQSVAATSRAVVTQTGEILCTFMLRLGLDTNDSVPCLARSSDAGVSWQFQGPIWPHLTNLWSFTCSISRSAEGDLFLFGDRTGRTQPGEPFWCQETLGILQNELIWSRSNDDGRTWLPPQPFQIPLPGAAETPAPMCVTRTGRWLAPYAPHNTFDAALKVDLQHVVVMSSDDEGKNWSQASAIRVTEANSYVAEAWTTELSDGRLLTTCWHLHRGDGDDYPNAYSLSDDQGKTWSPTYATPILGQSASLAPLPNGKVLFAYNQRRHGKPGVYLALAKPTGEKFNVLANEIVWRAATATQHETSGKSTSWTDFAFGEPSVTILPDDTVLVTLWCIQPDGTGIRFVKLKI